MRHPPFTVVAASPEGTAAVRWQRWGETRFVLFLRHGLLWQAAVRVFFLGGEGARIQCLVSQFFRRPPPHPPIRTASCPVGSFSMCPAPLYSTPFSNPIAIP